jgi:hypothetical protein
MDTSKAIEFLVIAAAVVGTAWEPRARFLARILTFLGISYPMFFIGVWVALAATFYWLFSGSPGFWPLLAVLTELAGVVYLAREVFMAQYFEEYERGVEALRPFVDLEPLANQGKYDKYVYEYYKLDGRTQDEADADMAVAKLFGTLEGQVEKLKESARRSFERPKGPLAVQTLDYRRHRLARGIVLVSIGLTGHGLHVLTR